MSDEIAFTDGADAMSARPPAKDRARERLLPDQKFAAPENPAAPQVAVAKAVSNKNLAASTTLRAKW